MGRTLSTLGCILTAAYLGALWLLVGGRLEWLQTAPLNEVGDFLAGAFGPLAIIWLVLGYFQQGIELRQNSEALHLQSEELANSVEQQKAMVKVAQEQHETERAALQHQVGVLAAEQERLRQASLPKFVLSAAGGSYGEMCKPTFDLTNLGAACTEIRLGFLEEVEIRISPDRAPMLNRDTVQRFTLAYKNDSSLSGGVLVVSFVDGNGNSGQELYDMALALEDNYVKPRFRALKG